MTGAELLLKIRKIGRRRGLVVTWDPRRGKGGHGTLYVGSRRVVMPSLRAELKTGTLHGILVALDLDVEDLE